jgi:acyl carrier protein
MKTEIDLQKKKDAIFNQLIQFISEIIGADVVEELIITKDSIFTKDLEMDSIEIVSLVGKVNNHYGGKTDYTSFLFNLEIDALINLSMGNVVDYISDTTDVEQE